MEDCELEAVVRLLRRRAEPFGKQPGMEEWKFPLSHITYYPVRDMRRNPGEHHIHSSGVLDRAEELLQPGPTLAEHGLQFAPAPSEESHEAFLAEVPALRREIHDRRLRGLPRQGSTEILYPTFGDSP